MLEFLTSYASSDRSDIKAVINGNIISVDVVTDNENFEYKDNFYYLGFGSYHSVKGARQKDDGKKHHFWRRK